MRYIGGKSRLSKPIAETILARVPDRARYIEPFIGGGASFAALAPHFEDAIGADVVEDVAHLWAAVADGWLPPESLSEDEYRALKADPAPSALRAFAGFGCSFGGKWFGGYARPDPKNDYVQQAHNSIRRAASRFSGADIRHADYRALDHLVTPGSVVYCDPPYAATQGYSAAGGFDSAEFWAVASEWAARGAHVFVSEYSAPPEWECVWEKRVTMQLAGEQGDARPAVVDRLFTR